MAERFETGVRRWAVVLVPDPESTPTALGIIRSLGRAGVPLATSASHRGGPSYTSRYVDRRLVCPPLEHEPESWKDTLIEFGKPLVEKPVLFPSADEHVIAIHHYRDEISAYFDYPFLDPAALLNCIDKRQMYKVCRHAGIEAGQTLLIDDPARVDEITAKAVTPSVLKPAMWIGLYGQGPRRYREFIHEFGQKAVCAHSPEELRNILLRVAPLSLPVLLQQEVPGPCDAICVVSLYADNDSEIRGLFVGRKTRQYPSDFGDRSMIENITCPRIEALARSLASEIGFHGIAEMEFKRHPENGRFHLMEINPRAGTWITAAIASGVNIPHLAYLDAIGAELPQMTQTKRPVRWIDGQMDMLYWLSYRRGDHTGRPLLLLDYLRTLRGRREYAYWATDDLVPGAARAVGLARDILRVLRCRIGFRRRETDGVV